MAQRTGLPERGSKENGWVYCRWKRSMRGVSGQIKRVRRSLQKEGLSPSSSSGLRFFMWISSYLYRHRKTGYARIVKIAEKCLHFKRFYVMLSELWHDS